MQSIHYITFDARLSIKILKINLNIYIQKSLQFISINDIINLSDMTYPKLQNERMIKMLQNEKIELRCLSDFTDNLSEMTNEQLRDTLTIVSDLYTKYDEMTDEYFGINEYFRTQIDIIVNYMCKYRFDGDDKKCFAFIDGE